MALSPTGSYVGRFAPTPSGDLHLGSLYAAVASFLDARAHGGRWLLRIEDIDQPREVEGAAAGILRTLQAFGFDWDCEVVRQRDRIPLYVDALRSLQIRNLTFECSCSRLQLEDENRYPGTCRIHPLATGVPTASRGPTAKTWLPRWATSFSSGAIKYSPIYWRWSWTTQHRE
jgi:glutamyl/glutaminyl-tRNA synthetase